MRKSLRSLTLAVLVVLSLSMALVAVQAQEATEEPTEEAMPEMTAEATAEMEMTPEMEMTEDVSMSDDMSMVSCDSNLVVQLYIAERYFSYGQMTTMDLTTIDKGEFAPLFDSMMSMPDMSSGSMTDDQMAGVSDTMATESDMDSMSPAMDEPEECSALRADLNRFFAAIATQDMDMSMEATPVAEVTAEATAEMSDGDAMDSVSFATNMSGPSEVPGPGDADATGTAAFTMDFANGQICYDVNVQNITLPAAAMHIHRGTVTESGSVVVPFDNAPDESGNAVGCVLVEADLLQEIASNPAGFYLNVHTSDFPDGALRGQVSS